MGGKRTMRTRPPENSGPLQKRLWSAQSWIFVQDKTEQGHSRGVENIPYEGGQNPFWDGSHSWGSTPPWRPLI